MTTIGLAAGDSNEQMYLVIEVRFSSEAGVTDSVWIVG
jgi:hypothetical protein